MGFWFYAAGPSNRGAYRDRQSEKIFSGWILIYGVAATRFMGFYGSNMFEPVTVVAVVRRTLQIAVRIVTNMAKRSSPDGF